MWPKPYCPLTAGKPRNIYLFGIYGSSRSYNTGARFKVHGGFWQEGEAHYLVQLGLSPKCCLGVPLVLKLGMFDIHVTCKDMAKHGIAFDGMTWHLMAFDGMTWHLMA